MSANADGGAPVNPPGLVRVQLRLTGRWPIATLTRGWDAQRKRALRAGDPAARAALIAAAAQRTLAAPERIDQPRGELTWAALADDPSDQPEPLDARRDPAPDGRPSDFEGCRE